MNWHSPPPCIIVVIPKPVALPLKNTPTEFSSFISHHSLAVWTHHTDLVSSAPQHFGPAILPIWNTFFFLFSHLTPTNPSNLSLSNISSGKPSLTPRYSVHFLRTLLPYLRILNSVYNFILICVIIWLMSISPMRSEAPRKQTSHLVLLTIVYPTPSPMLGY